jgi:predicted Ser/Thr protein kinase
MIGRQLKQYVIEGLLGKGGMGTVYRARDTRLQRNVALKVLPQDVTQDPDRRSRFLREARAAAAITHPSVAQVYDVDEADGVTFIAMELIEGETVRRLIERRELDLAGALDIAIQTAEGLARAHESGVVHRDIKSENIMVTRDGHAKVLDFGLAKLDPLRSDDDAQPQGAEDRISQLATMAQTRAGAVIGTLAYMSPEQARGKPVDFRSDIFSFGVTLYEMVTGTLPFAGDSALDTMHAIAFEETRPVTSLRPNIPPDLHRIISRCLRKRPEDRYPSTRDLIEDLRKLRKDVDSGFTRPVPLVEHVRSRLLSIGLPRKPVLIGIAAAAGLLLIGGIVWIYLKGGGFWPVLLVIVAGLWLYRHFKNRTSRLTRRFAARVSKLPEVRLVTARDRTLTVIVDKIQAKTYLRVHGTIEAINRKLFFGEPLSVTLKDDITPEEYRQMLHAPGIIYPRKPGGPPVDGFLPFPTAAAWLRDHLFPL